jgi:hypothetical protein
VLAHACSKGFGVVQVNGLAHVDNHQLILQACRDQKSIGTSAQCSLRRWHMHAAALWVLQVNVLAQADDD